MRERWSALCRRIGTQSDPAALATQLETLYSHPPRAYHNLDHIAAVLAVFDQHRTRAASPDFLEFALWLHDCVYDPRANDNELKSSDAAAQILRELDAPAHIDSVRSLIMATCHNAPNLEGDAALIADIDLSILAADATTYDAYAAAIRSEYLFVPDDLFRPGRANILRAFAARERIFLTPAFQETHEAAARLNLNRELIALEQTA